MSLLSNPFPQTTLTRRWWETAAGMVRPYLKAHGQTLVDLVTDLDSYAAIGIDTVEVFAPLAGGTCYNGLDTIDFYQIDSSLGSLEDFLLLIGEAHRRKMGVVLFINLGYCHEQFPAFLKACDDVKAGVGSNESHMFLWSENGRDCMDRSYKPYFMNDSHGNWRWSDRAGKYYWVKWEGEKGGYHLPQFNFGDPGWQAEVQQILRFWLATGIDGLVIDAVNWYIGCNWDICRASMTDVILAVDNQLCQPEGAGGFHDDPVEWVRNGGWNCIMDYSIKLWWEGIDIIYTAVQTGDPRPIEKALQSYRDRVVKAGGVCYIDPPDLTSVSLEAQLLGFALVASIGELIIFIGDQTIPQPVPYRREVIRLLNLRKQYPALCAGGTRQQIATSDDSRFYAFLRSMDEVQILGVFNFQSTPESLTINLAGQDASFVDDLLTGESQEICENSLTVNFPAYGYKLFRINHGN